MEALNHITLILPYYRNPEMLKLQAREWAYYPPEIQVIVVDDGSPVDKAADVLPLGSRARVFEILVDIPWNRNGARNTGAREACGPWILHTDIDHILPYEEAWKLVEKTALSPSTWYKFSRFRVGKADSTRQKDHLAPDPKFRLGPDAEFGQIKPHVDSFLITREMYWKAGGYDEDFSGGLGGSSLLLKHLANEGPCLILEEVSLHVYTESACPDASDTHLCRKRERYARIRQEKRDAGDPKPNGVCRIPWKQVR